MGKAHTCVLTKSGEVWTFGVNNKGQCGRDTGSMSQAGKGTKKDTHKNRLYVVVHISLYCFCLVQNVRLFALALIYSIRRGEHGHSHGWRLGGRAGREGREEHDVPARHAQVEAGPVHGLHSVWRLHRLRCQLRKQWTARQSTRRVRGWCPFYDLYSSSDKGIISSYIKAKYWFPFPSPTSICGCGSGESGCSACGCCKACARELDGQEARQRGIFDAVKEMIPLDLLLGMLTETLITSSCPCFSLSLRTIFMFHQWHHYHCLHFIQCLKFWSRHMHVKMSSPYICDVTFQF